MQIHAPADAARAIKSRRLALGLTQLEAAQAIGITRQSLARIEQANGGGAFDTYLRLFDLLGIALSAELPSAADEPAESMPDASGVSRGGARFLPEGATSWPGAAPSSASREQVAGDRLIDQLRSVVESLEPTLGVSALDDEDSSLVRSGETRNGE